MQDLVGSLLVKPQPVATLSFSPAKVPGPGRPTADHELLSHSAQRNLPLNGDTFACQVVNTELSLPEKGEVHTVLLSVVAPVHPRQLQHIVKKRLAPYLLQR